MTEENEVGRRDVLRTASGLLGASLVSAGAAGATNGATSDAPAAPVPAVTDVEFYELDTTGLELPATSIPDGETIEPVATVGNGTFAMDGTGGPAFYGLPDSGPEIDCEDAAALAGRSGEYFCEGGSGASIRPNPEFSPSIYELQVGDGTVERTGETVLVDAAGDEISTLSNPLSNGTTPMVSVEGEPIEYDPNGLDPEAVARTAEGTFWLAEEYAPSIVEVAADGEILGRHVPESVSADLTAATYPVEGSLPAVFARRDGGRGIESIGLTPDESTLFFSLQSPLANPDADAFASSRNVRLGTFDPDAGTVEEQYLYRLDEPETFTEDAAAGDVVQSDVKVSEISVVDQDLVLVLERVSRTTKFYLVDVSQTEPVPATYDDPATRPTLAQANPEEAADIEPLTKELLFTTDDYDGFPRKLEGIARPTPDELLIANDSDWELEGGETRIAHVELDGPLGRSDDGSDGGTGTLTESGIGPAPTIEPIGRYTTGAAFDEAGAEIPAYDPATHRLFSTNGAEGVVDVLDVSDPAAPGLASTIDTTTAFEDAGGPTNVSVANGVLAVAIPAEDEQANGAVGFYDSETLAELGVVQVGPLPDAVTFTPDGETVLVANEGEPSSDYAEDPNGSVSIIDGSDGFDSATAETAGFGDFVGQETQLREDGVRIYGPGSTAAQDFEPEYVSVAPDGERAYATLQENNAIAIVDVEDATLTDVVPLGYKDFSAPGNELDAVDDGEIDLQNWPIYGMYQPDVVETYAVDGDTYLVISNEGDAREYEALWETGVLVEVDGVYGLDTTEDDGDNVDVKIDESAFEKSVLDALLGLEATTQKGDVDDDGELEALYAFGGRSFSVLDAEGQQVHESGDAFERIVARALPSYFNASDDENGLDEESLASGPEPEGVALGDVAGSPFAFLGFEEVGGFAAYDVSEPARPQFVQYLNTRDFSVDPEAIEASQEDDDPSNDVAADAAGDLAPEGLAYVPAGESPIEDPLLVVGYEVSGTVVLYRIETGVLGIDSVAVTSGATGSVDLSMLAAMDGFSGGRLTVSVADPDVARIADATVEDDLLGSASVANDGSAVELSVADLENTIQPGTTEASLATIDLEGTAIGTTDLLIDVETLNAESGEDADPETRNGLVVTGPPALGEATAAPADPDGDGRFEDVNGNGRLDFHDVVLLFENLESDAVRLNASAFDFNENGKIDYDDVVDLYQEI